MASHAENVAVRHDPTSASIITGMRLQILISSGDGVTLKRVAEGAFGRKADIHKELSAVGSQLSAMKVGE